ncbi:MAG: phosphoribosylaminoimidazolesuccinocarboxamide synthase [Patescibacteria group bacterium]
MAKLPSSVNDTELTRLVLRHLPRIHQGKVRDTFAPPHHSLLLQLATDRISIFDFVLNDLIPEKGACLTAMTVFWLTEVLQGIDHHLVAYGKDIDNYLPRGLCGNKELQSKAIIVKRLEMLEIECIVRGYLTGTGYAAYKQNGMVCGILLPPGLRDGSRIPGGPIFTPTTKAEEGHDEHISADSVDPAIKDLSIQIFRSISEYAESKGIILADTKFEFDKNLCLGDEVATPDSSRYWSAEEWEKAQKENKSPSGFDKQPVRNEGSKTHTPFISEGMIPIMGINNLNPLNPRHLEWVHDSFSLSKKTVEETSRRYQFVLEKLIGMPLAEFQKKKMEIV